MTSTTVRRATAAAVAAVAFAAFATAPAAGKPKVLVGAGDIAGCAWLGDEATADLLDDIPGTVFTTGDNVYLAGTLTEYLACYEPSWGRHKSRTRPAPGNHDWLADPALGYFPYFGTAAGPPNRGYYSYDLGAWHVVVLNGECYAIGGCEEGSPQERWLRADLAASRAKCTAAVFHYPLFNSGRKGNIGRGRPMWQALYDHGAEIMLSGDDHLYERFAPQDPDGEADPKGIRQFTVGTGGSLLNPFSSTIQSNSEARIQDVHGVLKLTLTDEAYAWEFVPVAGQTATDSGSARCHN